MNSEVVDSKNKSTIWVIWTSTKSLVNEPATDYENSKRNIEKGNVEFLNKGTYTSKEILLGLKLIWDSRTDQFLKKESERKKSWWKPAKFTRRTDVISPTLFG